MSDVQIWVPDSIVTIPTNVDTATEIAKYAVQLAERDKRQIVEAITANHLEMAISYLWGKTLTTLKRELSSVGVSLLAEMLGKPPVDEKTNIEDVVSHKEAIQLAEELGVVSHTDAIRLRNSLELLQHFSQMESSDAQTEELERLEALGIFKLCVRAVLGRQRVEVAKKFVDFRQSLEFETLSSDHPNVEALKNSPYFFKKLTISVLLNSAKQSKGANLEHTLANMNVIFPLVWPGLKDAEKWQIGHTYAEMYSDGNKLVVAGLKSALLKVKGFDFVPETLRSDTFIKAAEEIVKAHEGMNNFYTEVAPVDNLAKLGSIIPTPAVSACVSALMCVCLGNHYGTSWAASSAAEALLSQLSKERWTYYFNSVFSSDTRIIYKLMDERPRKNWLQIVKKCELGKLEVREKNVRLLLSASKNGNEEKITEFAQVLLNEYYGKGR